MPDTSSSHFLSSPPSNNDQQWWAAVIDAWSQLPPNERAKIPWDRDLHLPLTAEPACLASARPHQEISEAATSEGLTWGQNCWLDLGSKTSNLDGRVVLARDWRVPRPGRSAYVYPKSPVLLGEGQEGQIDGIYVNGSLVSPTKGGYPLLVAAFRYDVLDAPVMAWPPEAMTTAEIHISGVPHGTPVSGCMIADEFFRRTPGSVWWDAVGIFSHVTEHMPAPLTPSQQYVCSLASLAAHKNCNWLAGEAVCSSEEVRAARDIVLVAWEVLSPDERASVPAPSPMPGVVIG